MVWARSTKPTERREHRAETAVPDQRRSVGARGAPATTGPAMSLCDPPRETSALELDPVLLARVPVLRNEVFELREDGALVGEHRVPLMDRVGDEHVRTSRQPVLDPEVPVGELKSRSSKPPTFQSSSARAATFEQPHQMRFQRSTARWILSGSGARTANKSRRSASTAAPAA